MRSFLLLFSLALLGAAQSSLAQEPERAPHPFIIERTYWVKPGKEKQFVALYRKTELLRLQREQQAGRLLWIRLSQPLLSAGNEQWDFRVVLAWRSSDAAQDFSAQSAQSSVDAKDAQRVAIEEAFRRDLIENQTDMVVIEANQ